MKVAFVVPRYGADIRGGAEVGARMLAERLVADRGFEVEVLTTCALDAITWRDELPEGATVERGVTVRRIRSQAGRNEHFHPLWAQLMEDPGAASAEDCAKWVAWQGPLATDLVEAVAASDADVVAFYPYLYYPTVYGLPLVRERAVLHPAAHEEPALHLPVFDELFRMCRGFAFHSRSERALVNARFGVAIDPAGASRARRGSARGRWDRWSSGAGRRAVPGLHRAGGRPEGDGHALALVPLLQGAPPGAADVGVHRAGGQRTGGSRPTSC